MRKIKICLDAGHASTTSGKRTPAFENGTVIKEIEQNFPIMIKTGEYLRANGFDVIYTNLNKDSDKSLDSRVKVANDANADLFVSIHKDAITGTWQTSAKGITSYVYKKGGNAEKVANKIHSSLIETTMMYNRGVREANFQVLRETEMSAVLVELGFMDYKEEAIQMQDSRWHNIYAKAIAEGICDYYGVKFVDKEVTQTATVNDSWKKTAIESLLKDGILTDKSWLTKTKDTDYIPLWAFAIVIERLNNKIKELGGK